MSLIFNKIVNENIFTKEFNPFIHNNEIVFSGNGNIAVIYGPNGAGKTSLIKALSDNQNTQIEFEYDGKKITKGEVFFHVINDQNNRNIISGNTQDFLLGDNIRHEIELQEYISIKRDELIGTIISILKKEYGITSSSTPLIRFVSDSKIATLIKDFANSKSKGKKYETLDIIKLISQIKKSDIKQFDNKKMSFLKEDYPDKDSVIQKIEALNNISFVSNPHVQEIEENTEAINILNRFHKNQCIVCDTKNIDWELLLKEKTVNRENVYNTLAPEVREAIEKIIGNIPENDPFLIKQNLLEAINTGNKVIIQEMLKDIDEYKQIYSDLLLNTLLENLSSNDIQEKMDEFQNIVSQNPEITDEDYLYISEIISNSMNKPLSIERDNDKHLRIFLSNQEFIGKDRGELPLSSGEQNFLSLTFEFLKAKNSPCPIVVIDDPISSFDSIYKNKVVYSIVKILHNKKRMILTHNIDVIYLLNSQYTSCFKLYLLNNTDGEMNGFIPISIAEKDMLISIEKLLETFRDKIFSYIKDINIFLISMIPFMRGYANIINNKTIYDELTQVMHGYKTKQVDISKMYIELFGNKENNIPSTYIVSTADILSSNADGIVIIDNTRYPLLNKTLRHSFTYLYLRLLVEKTLVDKFSLTLKGTETLGQIISMAFPNETSKDQICNRVKLTSKKTLINEFNHFEGNLSIFQPAIDITDQALNKEKKDIIEFLNTL